MGEILVQFFSGEHCLMIPGNSQFIKMQKIIRQGKPFEINFG